MDGKQQRHAGGGDVSDHTLKFVDVEGPANMIAGEMLRSGVDRQAIIAGLSRLFRHEAPLGFVLRDTDRPGNPTLRATICGIRCNSGKFMASRNGTTSGPIVPA